MYPAWVHHFNSLVREIGKVNCGDGTTGQSFGLCRRGVAGKVAGKVVVARHTSSPGATPASPCAATTASDGSLRSSRPPAPKETVPRRWPRKVRRCSPEALSTCG